MKSIQIQSVGRVQAKPASEFKAGDVMVWNFGMTTKVLGVAKETAKMITYTLEGDKGTTHERKFAKTRLVAFA